MAAKPSLRTELLFNLAFLAAAALLLGVVTVLLVSAVAPERAVLLILTIVAADVAIFIVFGRYVVTRHVLRPVARLVAAADAVAAGDFAARAPEAETSDFTTLAERLNRMTDHLLDAQGQLVRSEKLASVGRLASGIAHEVGNPLGAGGTYLEVLRRRGADPEVVAGLSRELERIDRIVRSLLDYARPQEEALGLVDTATVVRGAYVLVEAQGALKPVRAALEIVRDVPPVPGLAARRRGVRGGGRGGRHARARAGARRVVRPHSVRRAHAADGRPDLPAHLQSARRHGPRDRHERVRR